MKETLRFQVTVEKSPKEWLISDKFNTYDEAQKWRHQQEAELLKANPTRSSVRSNLLFVHEVEDAQ